MKIGILDTEHFECVYPLIRLFDDGTNDLFLVVNENCAQQVQYLLEKDKGKYFWFIQPGDQSGFQFLWQVKKWIRQNNISLLILNTVSKHHVLYAMLLGQIPGVQTILTIHDLNCMFHPSPGITPRSWARYIGKKILLKKVQWLNTISETVLPNLKKNKLPHHKVICLPPAIYEGEESFQTIENEVRIVVAGSIEEKRRNYSEVFDLLAELKDFKINVTLLGSPVGAYGKMILEQCKEFGCDKIKTFPNAVDQATFDSICRDAHFFWMPVKIHTTSCEGISEIYGQTKSSGTLGDVIRFGKPFMIPDNFELVPVLESAAIRYENVASIAHFLRKVKSDPNNYVRLAENSQQISLQFSVSRLRETRLGFLQEIHL